MGLFDKIESSVGDIVGRLNSSDLKPSDFVQGLYQEIEDKIVEVDHGRIVAPNQFTIFLSSTDFDKVEGWNPSEFANELARTVAEYMDERQYAYIGPINVIFEENTDALSHELDIRGEAKRSNEIPSNPNSNNQPGQYNSGVNSEYDANSYETPSEYQADSNFPFIEINGKRYSLKKEFTIIGRGSDCDIIVSDHGISRHHLELHL
ncbi:MAG: DUF3662 domain-containing protein, partial [Candidatus Ancillula sp.]|nr:DUF3662 domain-containing protein [Candidatus Ancillula sp.]